MVEVGQHRRGATRSAADVQTVARRRRPEQGRQPPTSPTRAPAAGESRTDQGRPEGLLSARRIGRPSVVEPAVESALPPRQLDLRGGAADVPVANGDHHAQPGTRGRAPRVRQPGHHLGRHRGAPSSTTWTQSTGRAVASCRICTTTAARSPATPHGRRARAHLARTPGSRPLGLAVDAEGGRHRRRQQHLVGRARDRLPTRRDREPGRHRRQVSKVSSGTAPGSGPAPHDRGPRAVTADRARSPLAPPGHGRWPPPPTLRPPRGSPQHQGRPIPVRPGSGRRRGSARTRSRRAQPPGHLVHLRGDGQLARVRPGQRSIPWSAALRRRCRSRCRSRAGR